MSKNKIIYIEINSWSRFMPDITIHRHGGIDHLYDLDKIDNSFNSRRFLRGVKMASELYRRQSSGHSQD